MFSTMAERIERLLLAVWVGSMMGIGYIAAPVLFKMLDERQLAGELAGQMFFIIFIVGAVIGAVLLGIQILRQSQKCLRQWRCWVLVMMWSLVLLSLFVIQPMMADLKAQGLVPGSEAASRFGMMHGISSLMYLVTTLSGLLLLWAGLRPSEHSRPQSAIGGQI